MSRFIPTGDNVTTDAHLLHMDRCANAGGIVQAINYDATSPEGFAGSHVWYNSGGVVYHSSLDACNAPLPDVSGKARG